MRPAKVPDDLAAILCLNSDADQSSTTFGASAFKASREVWLLDSAILARSNTMLELNIRLAR
jgi:hypothetical protein